MPQFIIPCYWEVSGTMYIEADTLDEAIDIAIKDEPLPESTSFISGSFEVNQEMVEFFNKREPSVLYTPELPEVDFEED